MRKNFSATLALVTALTAALLPLSGCDTLGKFTASPGAISADKTLSELQEKLKWGCLALQGASVTFDYFAPALMSKFGPEAPGLRLAAQKALNDFCNREGRPVEQAEVGDLIARVYDLAGQIKAMVDKAAETK